MAKSNKKKLAMVHTISPKKLAMQIFDLDIDDIIYILEQLDELYKEFYGTDDEVYYEWAIKLGNFALSVKAS